MPVWKGRALRYISRNEWLAYGLLVVAAVAVSLPLFPYRMHTFLHIAGAVVFLGNIVVTAAWMLMAERSRSLNVIHFSAKAVIRADLLFTLPGVLLILLNGTAMVLARWGGWGAFHEMSWISLALALFTLSGAIWVGILITVQHRTAVCSDPSGYEGEPPAKFLSALRRWYFWGAIAIALPVCSLYLMVTKPTLG